MATVNRVLICVLALAFVGVGSHSATADSGGLELGGFAGGHVFSEDNELGAHDLTGGPTLDSFALLGGRVGYGIGHRLVLEGEALLIPTKDSSGATALTFGYRAHGLANILTGKVRPFVVLGAGAHSVRGDGAPAVFDDTDLALHYGAGIKVRLSPRLFVRFDARHLLVPSRRNESLTSDFEAQLGISYSFGATAAALAPEPETAPADTDGDGLADADDTCPNEAEDLDGFEDNDGCPDPDNDDDGILDAADKCPSDPESRNGIDDEDGCPEMDTDGDGVFGSLDKCPNQAEDPDGFEDSDGCPDPDNDGDGVADADDKCPTELETANGYEDEDGCKDDLPVAVQKFTGVISGIRFHKGSAEIRSRSIPTLKDALKIFKEYPELRLEVGGHSSDDGKAEINQELSKRRAEAVRDWLIANGIAAERITAVGYGSSQPKSDNDTTRGRRLNRRIEFRLLSGQVK